MAADSASDILARLLGVAPDEARRQLDRFAGGMTAELLDRKRLTVAGLGVFFVVHEQAARETTASGTRYQPPKNRVAFEAGKERAGDAERIATVRLGMEVSEAKRFVKALGEMFAMVKKEPGRLELRGFGSFTLAAGTFRFLPEASLESLLNIGYGDLKEIVIPERAVENKEAPQSRAESGGVKKVALVAAAIAMLACGWFLYRQFAPGGVELLKAESVAESSAPVSMASNAPPSSTGPGIVPSSPDSLILGKGRFTVIVATFNTRKVAKQEMARLSGPGRRIMVWPVRSGGVRYYRLVTGDFETRPAALDSVKALTRSLSRELYIQQAPKNVVLYGEQGL